MFSVEVQVPKVLRYDVEVERVRVCFFPPSTATPALPQG
jgi:hypothetical protein